MNIPPVRATELQSTFQSAFSLHVEGRLDEAKPIYEELLEVHPEHFNALHSLGVLAIQQRNFDRALALLERAIAIHPGHAAANYNRGLALGELQSFEDAIASFDNAIAINPRYAAAHFNRGHALMSLQRFQDALGGFDRAIAINPGYAAAYANRGNALFELKLPSAAVASYEKALAIKPDLDFIPGILLNLKMQQCQWAGIDQSVATLKRQIERGERATPPFQVIALLDEPMLQRAAAETWVRTKLPSGGSLGAVPARTRKEKIRLGYYSADYYEHATCHLMAGLFEEHDRNLFELIAFSFGPDTSDEMQRRVACTFDEFIDVRALSDKDVAALSRELEIDIAIDLKGLTHGSRLGIFAERCAPVQVSYLGYPGTSGAGFIDYIVADRIIIPRESQRYYSENVVYLPGSYQANDRKRRISDNAQKRADCGLPDDAFVFCCFHQSYKITPSTFAGWIRILRGIPQSVLWLLESSETAAKNLLEEADKCGIDRKRLIFAKKLPLAEHLARHRLADLFLDTFPCNAHTTASDALWAGLPVLTQMGKSFASRVGGSLLGALGLPQLVAQTQKEYEAIALELATSPTKLAPIKQTLGERISTSALFDTVNLTRHMEAAYVVMLDRYHDGLPPSVIDLSEQ